MKCGRRSSPRSERDLAEKDRKLYEIVLEILLIVTDDGSRIRQRRRHCLSFQLPTEFKVDTNRVLLLLFL